MSSCHSAAQAEQPIRLSHSTLELFDRCERLFQLEKLVATDVQREESEHLSFGTAYGVGVAEYLQHQDPAVALYKAWLAYWPEIETDKKNVSLLVSAFQASVPRMDTLLRDYEIATFNNKPAVELSFRVNITAQYYYVGYIDVVLRNRWDGTYMVLDAKSTGLGLTDLSPSYQNSGQALGYSIVLDTIVGKDLSDYAVCYFVAQIKKDLSVQVHPLIFQKTLLDRFNWMLTLGGDIKRLETAAELGFYPRRGGACLKYNRPCRHFGTCGLSALDTPKQIEPDIIDYDFTFDLDALIDNHIQRITSPS
jgi:hypothetical protein